MLDNGMFPQNGLFKDEDGNIVSIIALLKKISENSGGNARMIELQKGETHIQWKYTDEEVWNNLISIQELTGPQGPKGNTGNTGKTGPQGPAGFATEEQYNDIIRRLEALEQPTATKVKK